MNVPTRVLQVVKSCIPSCPGFNKEGGQKIVKYVYMMKIKQSKIKRDYAFISAETIRVFSDDINICIQNCTGYSLFK